ncbi:MAG: hypothetical protein QXE73_05310 [Candidatus Bathyarchaeia archaeon]
MFVYNIYNRFRTLRNAAEATLAQMRVALRKRLDMMAQLVKENYLLLHKGGETVFLNPHKNIDTRIH